MARCLAGLRSDRRAGKMRDKLLQFYARRIKRIVPVYVAVICGTLRYTVKVSIYTVFLYSIPPLSVSALRAQ